MLPVRKGSRDGTVCYRTPLPSSFYRWRDTKKYLAHKVIKSPIFAKQCPVAGPIVDCLPHIMSFASSYE
jgi:hypothetical protein